MTDYQLIALELGHISGNKVGDRYVVIAANKYECNQIHRLEKQGFLVVRSFDRAGGEHLAYLLESTQSGKYAMMAEWAARKVKIQ